MLSLRLARRITDLPEKTIPCYSNVELLVDILLFCLKNIMLQIKRFIFSPFAENTYLIYEDSGECLILDPGCYTENERTEMKSFIQENQLTPRRLLNTHGHLDHLLGNAFIKDTYQLTPEMHQADEELMKHSPDFADNYGFSLKQPPDVGRYIEEGDRFHLGESELVSLHIPGHSPGSVVFICHKQQLVFSGDVLFAGSVGRTDLPGGNYEQLVNGIQQKLMTLKDNYQVFPGHGEPTTIGAERKNNVFLQ